MEDVIVEALLSNEREAQILAARELGKLATKLRQKLAERGIISRLVTMLCTQDYEATEAALCALLCLAFHSERNKIRIANSGAIPVLLEIIQCPKESLVDLAAAALLVLSSCSANKLAIAASGAIPILVGSLNSQLAEERGFQNLSVQAKLDIISTFHNLSTYPPIIPSIVSSGMVKAMLQLMYGFGKQSEIIEKAMALLEKMVSSSEIALEEVAETAPLVIHFLVEAVEEGTPLCKEHAAAALLVICQSCRDRYRGMILREGAMPGLLQLSVDGTSKAREKAKALLQLLRDFSECRMREERSKNRLLEHVMQQIDKGDTTGTGLRLVEDMIARLRT
ncbi:unnamed protein product [Coffea canephora]|uniref:Armadillo repeat-containing domain-containing protein n=1 Tax=Coffea canephora TaxID=49390 RepID=A0A068U0L0_COFCA|nr:unnamed protein product [Coffea canephora]